MRRLGRWMLNAMTVLSLVLCVGTVWIWVRSYQRTDYLVLRTMPDAPNDLTCIVREYHLISVRGKVGVGQVQVLMETPKGSPYEAMDRKLYAEMRTTRIWSHECDPPAYDTFLNLGTDLWGNRVAAREFFGFHYERSRVKQQFITGEERQGTEGCPWFTDARWAALVPPWFIVVITASAPIWRAISLVRRRHLQPIGHCQRCGYDLRATPDRCPECGTAAKGAAT